MNDSTTLKDTILQSGHVSAQVFTEGYKRKLQQRTVTWITEYDKHVLQDYTGFDFYCFLNRPTLLATLTIPRQKGDMIFANAKLLTKQMGYNTN